MRRFYGGLAMLLALIPAATIAAPATSPASAAATGVSVPPPAEVDYDAFDKVTVNSVVNGVEESVTGFVNVTTPSFDTRGFTVQPLESDPFGPGTVNRNGCSGSPPSYAGKTAWLRFNPGVKGVLTVRAITTTYNAVLMVREGTKRDLGQTSLTDLDGHINNCSDVNPSPGAEQVSTDVSTCTGPNCFILTPNANYFIQVGGRCPEVSPGATSPTTCSNANAANVPGGPTQLQVTFVPDDGDGDGVPDTNDVCAGTGPGVRVNTAGCPDADGDGIADTADQCPSAAGVTNPAPYNGCPAGPTPPFGPDPFVTVQALDGNNLNTSSVNVRLQLNWPQGAQEVVISNGDGSFGPPQRLSAPYVPWTLPPLQNQASEARQVKVIYRGPGIAPFQDSDLITLDTVKPVAPQSEFSKMADRRWHFFVKATDQGTGIRQIQMLDGRRKVLATKNFCTKSCDTAERIGLYSKKAKPGYARVTDLAGNRRVIRLDRSLARCGVPPYKVYRDNSSKSRCFAIGEECVREPWDWKNADIPLACRKVGDTFRVQHR